MNYDEIISQHTKKLIEAENKLLDKINLSIAKRYQRLEKELKKRYPTIKNNDSLLFSQKAAILQSELKNHINIAAGDFSKDFTKLYETSSKASVELSSSSPNNPNLSTSHDRSTDYHNKLNQTILNDSIRRLNRWGDEFVNKGNAIVEMGFQQGWSQEKVASVLRSQLGSLQSRVENIVRTSNSSAANKTLDALSEANGDNRVIWWAQVDDRLCPFCAARHGNIYKRKEVSVPVHGRCRCILLPVDPKKVDRTAIARSREEVLAELEKAGGKPRSDAAPFEKQNGVKAPKPVWTPEKGYIKKSTTKTLKKLTLAELKIKAEELGLTTKEIAGFGSGDLRTKDVWIKAIRSH